MVTDRARPCGADAHEGGCLGGVRHGAAVTGYHQVAATAIGYGSSARPGRPCPERPGTPAT